METGPWVWVGVGACRAVGVSTETRLLSLFSPTVYAAGDRIRGRLRPRPVGQQARLPLLLHLGVRRSRQRLEIPVPVLQEWRRSGIPTAP